MSDVPKIVCAIKVLRDLSVQVYRGQYSVNTDSLKWLLGDELKLTCWSQLSSLLSHFSSCGDDVGAVSVQSRVNTIVRHLQDLIEVTAADDQFNADIGNLNVEPVSSVRDLGVYLNTDMLMDTHIT